MQSIKTYAHINWRYCIYGTTLFARYCCDKICELYGESAVLGYLESEKKNDPFFNGKPIFLPSEAVEKFGQEVFFLIAGFTSYAAMTENLINIGVAKDHIIRPLGFEPYFKVGYNIQLKHVCFWPKLCSSDEDVLKKIAWFLPERVNVHVFSEENLNTHINDNVFVHKLNEISQIMKMVDAILLWDLSREENVGEKFGDKIRVVDPDFYMNIDAENYCRAYYASFSREEQDAVLQDSKGVFKNMQEQARSKERANVFGTGPSLFEIGDFKQFQNDLNIICNSMVKDKNLLVALQPDIIAFADICFYVSPSDYCKAFYKDLIDAYETYGLFIVVRDCQKPLIEYHFPELKGCMAGIPYKYDDCWWLLGDDDFYFKPLDNIVTDMMLPIATSLCDTVGIAGCTGRAKDETYFWKHNHSVQYEDLKPTVFSMWRAFFHSRRYDAYFEQHCRNMKQLIKFGESLGKKYINFTTSYIPILAQRSSNETNQETYSD